ncbi:hypothetical protein OS493_039432 [Desmophyllum pertusum]|uniref:Uncharacterized protein n=1 Tax=Desmophyllum pertusum TaxID=174260 RepID=A0A9W9ZI04_9CNID|nr:hypothetical protein OS493_039432 [Desmophyllum pertusum]
MEGNEDCVEETETVVGKENSSFILKDEDSLDVDLYEDLSVNLNQEMTYSELKKLYEESQQKIKELEAEVNWPQMYHLGHEGLIKFYLTEKVKREEVCYIVEYLTCVTDPEQIAEVLDVLLTLCERTSKSKMAKATFRY